MFGNRKRRGSSNPPPLNGPISNASATTAAASAYLKNQASNTSLASAAAGAALRLRPTTPTSVADTQTKRTVRRSGSTTSMGSSIGSSYISRPGLQRRGSSGSMTERTFRDQSPARAVPSAPDAPPVPAIPGKLSLSQKSHRRAVSMEPPPMRVASPPPNPATGRGSSLGPRNTAMPPRKAGQRKSSLSSVQEVTGLERSDSRGSVNFSYPMGSRPTSPISMTQRRLTSPSPSSERERSPPAIITSPDNQNLIYDKNSRRFIPAAQYYAIEYGIDQRIEEAAKPVKKKKIVAPPSAGTHLAQGTVGGRPKGTAIDATEAAISASHSQKAPERIASPPPVPSSAAPVEPVATTPKKKKKKVVTISESGSDNGSTVPSSTEESDVWTDGFNTRAGALLAKKPSIVREDREREEEEDDTPRAKFAVSQSSPNARPISPTPLPRSAAGKGHGRGQALASAALSQGRQHTRSTSQPAIAATTSSPKSALASKGSVRVQSVSPGRTTHFAASPDSLVVRHHPPPRSISPRKSALKHSNSPRGPSPAEDRAAEISQVEDLKGSPAPAEDLLPLPRKKANRVSFDEANIVVGQAASPVVTDSPLTQSPQSKKSWFSIGRGKKKDATAADDDEIMKPRPALPLFGSVRAKKDNRELVEERQLVKPAEPIDSTPSSTPPLATESTGDVSEYPLGQSNDHNVGSIIQDASSKNAANISKSREPLPSQLTSSEGSEHSLDAGLQTGESQVAHESKLTEDEPEIDPSKIDRESQTPTPTGISTSDVPSIAIVQSTPTHEKSEWPDVEHMPGGWNGSSTSDSGTSDEVVTGIIEHNHTDPTTPATIGIAEPIPPEIQPGAAVLGDIASENTHAIPDILEETEDESSVYDDAAEDLSEGDGDGFQSLNAVIESPVVASAFRGLAISTPPESPTVKTAKEKAYKSSLSKKSSEPDIDQGWEKAQEYWKGLTVEKRRQLEQQARDDAEAEDSDSTIEAAPTSKPLTIVTTAQPAVTPAPANRKSNSTERTYMIQPGSKAGPDGHGSSLRSSMRPDSSEDTHIRKSMRGQGSMRGTLRTEESKSNKARPVSMPAPQPTQAAVKSHVRNLSAASAAAASDAARRDTAPKPVPVLQRKSSSDSESSFKRARKANGSTMKRSMRGASQEPPQTPNRSSRFSIRSLSPTGSTRRPFSSGAAPISTQLQMRNSLRDSSVPAPSVRGPKPSHERNNSGSFPTMGRASSARPSSARPSARPAPKSARQRSSRFVDSSDEEDARPTFRSRFADSDDSGDELPSATIGRGFGRGTMRATAPARDHVKRGITYDGDSSDLPDGEDEKKIRNPLGLKLGKDNQNGIAVSQGTTVASGTLHRSGSGLGALNSPTTMTSITAGTTRPNQARRGSFMSILRRKKADPESKVRKSEVDSAARRDTPLERSKSDLAMVKRQDSELAGTAPSTPKLQKKPPAWPLINDTPPRITGGEDGRPFTADPGDGNEATNGNSTRPDMGRRFTATGLAELDLSGVGAARKKKKFGALRRIFRLDD